MLWWCCNGHTVALMHQSNLASCSATVFHWGETPAQATPTVKALQMKMVVVAAALLLALEVAMNLLMLPAFWLHVLARLAQRYFAAAHSSLMNPCKPRSACLMYHQRLMQRKDYLMLLNWFRFPGGSDSQVCILDPAHCTFPASQPIKPPTPSGGNGLG